MKYIVQIEIDPDAGIEIEANPDDIQQLIAKWNALDPLGFYFSVARRSVTVIVDVPNEDAMFEALHTTWKLAKTYPDVNPVMSAEEFPVLLQRAGIA